MKKILLLALTILISHRSGFSQVSVSQGSTYGFQRDKHPNFISFTKGTDYYFVFLKRVLAEKTHTLYVCDKEGNIKNRNDINIDLGVFNNAFNINCVTLLGDKILVLVNNPNKETGKNTLVIRTIDHMASFGETETKVGAIDFSKMMNQGFWNVVISPDKQHMTIIAQMPYEKEVHSKFKYYFFDAGLKKIKEGEFTLPGEADKASIDYYTSNNGDLYLVKSKYEKGNLIPTIYQTSISNPAVKEFNVLLNAPQKVFNFYAAVNPEGNLIMTGYYHENKTLTVGETQAKGVWIYSSTGSDVKTSALSAPSDNLTARGIVFNGNTTFLIGEQFKEDKEADVSQGAGTFDFNYLFDHKDIVVTAFDNSNLSKKFDVTLSKNWSGRNYDQDLYPAFGVINGKLAVVFNDHYGKYFPQASMYSDYKLPVLDFITNDGLLEQPIHFEKEFQITESGYTLYPRFFSNGITNELLMLSGNGDDVKGVIFRPKQ